MSSHDAGRRNPGKRKNKGTGSENPQRIESDEKTGLSHKMKLFYRDDANFSGPLCG